MATLICFVLSYLLFISVGSARGFGGQEGCSSSSCGGLRDIRYPFRLKSDGSNCGDRNYELECVGNNTFLEILSGKYLVTNIFYDNSTIEIVAAGSVHGGCNLPLQSLSASFISDSYRYLDEQYWAVFINCSKKINESNVHNRPMPVLNGPKKINVHYQPIPCLGQNNRFVYVTSGYMYKFEDNSRYYRDSRDYKGYGYSMVDLPPSCSYLTMVPFPEAIGEIAEDYLFQTLQNGFSLSWDFGKPPRFVIIKHCLRRAPRDVAGYGIQSEKNLRWLLFLYPFIVESAFLSCIEDFTDYALRRLSLVLIVFVDVAALLLVIPTLGRFIIAPLSIFVFLSYELRKRFTPIDTVEKFLLNQQTVMPTRYAYTDIIAMTRHFKEKLGQGGFGSVYKGELPGSYFVAVKMLGNSKCNGDDFINEVSTIGMIHHVNIVRLMGFCSEGSTRALVYEFMCNGSLDKYIFSSNDTNRKFTMEKLKEIALGVARGIDYLHRGCDMRILHFDIKPHNILLDQNFNPKVSDFGLAKLYPKDYSLVSACAARGTIGYMAPELVSRSFGLISHKSDVYSFGMLLLEMAGGRRNVDPRAENSSQAYYPSWIYDQLDQTERLGFCNGIEIDNVEGKLCKVGLWCIQMRPSFRPTMSEVIEMLEGDVDGVDMPPKPFTFSSTPSARRQSAVDSSLSEISVIYENE